MSDSGKRCTECNSDKTYLRNGKWEEWGRWNGKIVCAKCYAKHNARRWRQKYPEKARAADKRKLARTIFFKGKDVRLPKPIRKSICDDCGRSVKRGEISRTNITDSFSDRFW